MYVASIRVELHLPYAASLKDKRQILTRLKERLRAAHASVAEVDHADLWQRTALGLAVVTSSSERLTETLSSLREIVDRQEEIVVLDWHISHHE
ncbi:MAG: DUF503 domain-containing protein [Candidatus Eiseniibacteriota bacterium]